MNKTLIEHKCPCCGATVTFDIDSQQMKCPHCDSEFTTESFEDNTLPPDDMSWQEGQKAQFNESDGMVSYTCESCGGEIITDATTAATICPYCDSTVIMRGNVSGILKPDLIIPFKLDKNAAIEGFKNHLTKKALLPKVFKNENHIKECRGVYVPFWLFDAQADADVSFDATRVRTWSMGDKIYTETTHFDVMRSGTIDFEKIPVDGSQKMPNDLMESIEPYDNTQAVEFSPAFLSGYLANTYDVDKQTCIPRANTRIKQSTEDTFRQSVNDYSSVTLKSSSVRFKNSTAKYALYPVWLLNTEWNGQKFVFAMNGQTGRFVGNLPCDRGLFFKWLLGLFGISGAVFSAIAALIWFIGGAV